MMEGNKDETDILVISYNMHGYNQGVTALKSIIEFSQPSIIMLQEHWLTPTNLDKFSQEFSGYTAFGCSALEKNCYIWTIGGSSVWGDDDSVEKRFCASE